MQSQDFPGEIEIIICDDASTDATTNVVKRLALSDRRIKLIELSENNGAGYARNMCIAASTGNYVAIQDADDISETSRLRLLVEALEEDNQTSFVSAGHSIFDETGTYAFVKPERTHPTKWDLLWGPPFCHACTVFRREALVAVSGYRIAKETKRGQDYDLFLRLYSKGFTGKNLMDVLYQYRVDRKGVRRTKFKHRLNEIVIRWKGFRAMGILPVGIFFVLKPIPAHFYKLLLDTRRK